MFATMMVSSGLRYAGDPVHRYCELWSSYQVVRVKVETRNDVLYIFVMHYVRITGSSDHMRTTNDREGLKGTVTNASNILTSSMPIRGLQVVERFHDH
jgi:hypothetical protein